MAIECTLTECPRHPKDEPFCHEDTCLLETWNPCAERVRCRGYLHGIVGCKGCDLEKLAGARWKKLGIVSQVQKSQKTLVVMVGLPRSGKSTYARTLGHPIVNPDSIRIALHGQRFARDAEPMVWTIARYMVISLFEAGHDVVILDATNTKVSLRDSWVDKRWKRTFAFINTDVDMCIDRAKACGTEDLVPIIEKMAEAYEPFDPSELREWEK